MKSRINAEIASEADNLGLDRIGCTAAVLSAAKKSAVVINVGDSRV